MSGASETWPMESMTGTMAGLGRVPRSSQGGLYGHALDIFFVSWNYLKWMVPASATDCWPEQDHDASDRRHA